MEATRSGPRASSSRRKAWIRVRSTSPSVPGTLPPSASATGTASDLLVEVLFLFVGADVLLLEVRADHLVVGDVGDRFGLVDVHHLGGLDLALALRGAGRGGLSVARVLLVGSALGTDRLGLAQVVELRPAAIAVVFVSQLDLRHAD